MGQVELNNCGSVYI